MANYDNTNKDNTSLSGGMSVRGYPKHKVLGKFWANSPVKTDLQKDIEYIVTNGVGFHREITEDLYHTLSNNAEKNHRITRLQEIDLQLYLSDLERAGTEASEYQLVGNFIVKKSDLKNYRTSSAHNTPEKLPYNRTALSPCNFDLKEFPLP